MAYFISLSWHRSRWFVADVLHHVADWIGGDANCRYFQKPVDMSWLDADS